MADTSSNGMVMVIAIYLSAPLTLIAPLLSLSLFLAHAHMNARSHYLTTSPDRVCVCARVCVCVCMCMCVWERERERERERKRERANLKCRDFLPHNARSHYLLNRLLLCSPRSRYDSISVRSWSQFSRELLFGMTNFIGLALVCLS